MRRPHAARRRMLRTVVASHWPPDAVATPRPFSAAAISRSDLASMALPLARRVVQPGTWPREPWPRRASAFVRCRRSPLAPLLGEGGIEMEEVKGSTSGASSATGNGVLCAIRPLMKCIVARQAVGRPLRWKYQSFRQRRAEQATSTRGGICRSCRNATSASLAGTSPPSIRLIAAWERARRAAVAPTLHYISSASRDPPEAILAMALVTGRLEMRNSPFKAGRSSSRIKRKRAADGEESRSRTPHIQLDFSAR